MSIPSQPILKRKIFLLLSLILCSNFSLAQILVNEEWVQQYGLPDTVAWSASAVDASGNLYTTGNTFVSGNGTDILLTKYDADGVLQWQETYDHAGQNDYGVAMLLHSNGDIYLVATVFDLSNNFDIALIQYDTNGSLIGASIQDYQGDYDVPTSLIEDGNGDLYVSAAATGSNSDLDYLTLKFDDSRALLWNQSYDFVSGRDVPISLVQDGSDIVVTGASEDSTGQWDFYTIKYDDNGVFVEDNRLDKPGIGFDEPAGIARDNSGNFYLTGRASDNGVDYYIQTVKLDPQLNLLWDVSYSQTGQNGSTGLGLDSQGNVYVCGYLNGQASQELVLIKYDATGTEVWDIVETGDSQGPAAATSLHIDQQDQIYVIGYKAVNSQEKMYLTAFDTDGNKLWEQTPENGEFAVGEVITNGNDAYVSAAGFNNGTYQYVALKFSIYNQPYSYILKPNGDPDYVADEVIFKIPTGKVNISFSDNTDLRFGPASQVINDPNLISLIDQTLLANGDFQNWLVYKTHPGRSRFDTVATTRFGTQIKAPTLWNSFILKLPASTASATSSSPEAFSSYDPLEVSKSLDSLGVDHIIYAHPNYVFMLHNTPDDPEFVAGKQAGLINSFPTPISHVNAQGAWDFLDANGEQKGKPSIRVGVFDTGIFGGHEDFKFGTGNNLNSTVLDGGTEYITGSPIPISTSSTGTDFQGHGSSVAGIIGGLRNNAKGIAGIAGGDIGKNEGEGVHFISMTVFDASRGAPMSHVIMALGDAVLQNGQPLFELMNNSYGYRSDDPEFNANNIAAYREVMRLAYKAGIVMANSRGNDVDGAAQGTTDGTESIIIPASMSPNNTISPSFYDDWGICVGASNNDGNRQVFNDGRGDIIFSSDFGREMDLLAPGIMDLVFTIDNNSTTSYRKFNGTSASAPHVIGAAALLLGYSFAPLAIEDIEHLLEYSANDKTLTAGYDNQTGWGLLEIEEALRLIEKPTNQVAQFTANPNPSTAIMATPGIIPIDLAYDYELSNGTVLQSGPWQATVFQYTVTVNHNLGPSAQLVSLPTNKPPFWVRNSASNLFGPVASLVVGTGNQLVPEDDIQFNSANINSATVLGYYYEVELGNSMTVVIPEGADVNPQLSYSLLVTDPDGFPTSSDKLNEPLKMSLYPNPARDRIYVELELAGAKSLTLTVRDLQGRSIYSKEEGITPAGKCKIPLSTKEWPVGMYILEAQIGKEVIYRKFLKN